MTKNLTEKDARYAVQLCEAIAELPKVRRALTDKPTEYHDAVHLEMSAAEMNNGEGQGAKYYFYLPPALGKSILDAAERIVRDEMVRLGIQAPRK